MIPMEWPEQEHQNCEQVYHKILETHDIPAFVVIRRRLEDQEVKWDGVISELDQWCGYEYCCTSKEIQQDADCLLRFSCIKEVKALTN